MLPRNKITYISLFLFNSKLQIFHSHEADRAYLSEYPSREPMTLSDLQKQQSIAACPDLSEGENKNRFLLNITLFFKVEMHWPSAETRKQQFIKYYHSNVKCHRPHQTEIFW